MVRERKFDKSYSKELLQIAVGDYDSASALFEADKGRKENICYLAEQCIEKALKAALCALEISIPLVHDLGILIGRIPSENLPPFAFDLTDFTQFATVRRYEEGKAALTDEEISAALALSKQALTWAQKLVK